MEENKNLYYLKLLMSLLNFLILAFLFGIMIITTNSIISHWEGRKFLETVSYMPNEPVQAAIITFAAFFLLLTLIEVRKISNRFRGGTVIIYVSEILLCLFIIQSVYISYNGIILLAIADIVTDLKDKNKKIVFLMVMSLFYVIADYDVFSLSVNMISFQDYLNYYFGSTASVLLGIRNILSYINIIVFIMYMVIQMQNQLAENKKMAQLNMELQIANEKLKDYAQMQEKMGETKERNRVAREIHDTLGHTMTGLSAGLDACITLIDYSVESTKQQLLVLSEVARNGIKDIRRSVNKLRPDALDRLALQEAIQKMIDDFNKLSETTIYFDSDVEPLKFSTDEEDMIYRIIQEGITNAVRHGRADKVWIQMEKENKWLTISIKDNGIGCKKIKPGFGLTHIEERIRLLNGNVSYNGEEGFCITANIPIRWGEEYD